MPEISRFLGIIIRMYFKDHDPPRFHGVYDEYETMFSLATLQMPQGDMPPRAKGLIVE
ncbi:MAG TPA: DUF4160 domain-containing protein [Waddliaceae bacterium]